MQGIEARWWLDCCTQANVLLSRLLFSLSPQQYDYDSSSVRKRLCQDALVQVTLPVLRRSLATTCKPVRVTPDPRSQIPDPRPNPNPKLGRTRPVLATRGHSRAEAGAVDAQMLLPSEVGRRARPRGSGHHRCPELVAQGLRLPSCTSPQPSPGENSSRRDCTWAAWSIYSH